MQVTSTRPGAIRIHCGDVEQATEQIGQVLHPHTLLRVESVAHFHADLRAAQIGPIMSGWLQYNSNSDLYCPEVEGHHLNVPLSGALVSESRGVRTTAAPNHAVLYANQVDARISCPDHSRLNLFAMKFCGQSLQHALGTLTDRTITGPIRFTSTIDLSRGDGRAWWSLVMNAFRGQDSQLMSSPAMAEPLAYATMVGLLTLAEHNYSELMRAHAAHPGSGVIRTAADYIEAHAAEPLTPPEIAAAVGVGVRSLQRGFRAEFDCTPNEYLRSIRLRRAHDELVRSHAADVSVAGVAARWGFHHQGRFAALYRRAYGVSPAQTLRGS